MTKPLSSSPLSTPSHSTLHNQHVDVRMFSASAGTGSDDTAVIQAAHDAMSAGETLFLPSTASGYTLTNSVNISKSINIVSNGATITQTVAAKRGFVVTADNVRIANLKLVGSQYLTYTDLEDAFYVHGTDGTTPLTGLWIENCDISNWGQYGLMVEYVNDIHLLNNTIKNISLGGIHVQCCIRGTINNNLIKNITPGASGDTYGITLTRPNSDDLVTQPICQDITIMGNVVIDSLENEGIDLHGGLGITIQGNLIRRSQTGISCASARNSGGTDTYAPKAITITGNTVVSDITNGSFGVGIVLVGAGALGATVDAATGEITGNFVEGYGTDNASQTAGGIAFYQTQGVVVSGNTVRNAAGSGISIYHDNEGFTVVGNSVIDPWSEAASTGIAIDIGSGYNDGIIGGNNFARGSLSKTHVLDLGIYISNQTGNTISLFPNRSDATTNLSDAGNLATGLDYISPTVIRSYQEMKTHKQSNAAVSFRVRNDIALTNTSASAQFIVEAKDSSGFVGAFPSDYSTALLRDMMAIGANSDASGVNLSAVSSGQVITFHAGSSTESARFSKGSFAVGSAGALATNATDGFLYIPTCAGTPTGVPTAITGTVAMVFDTTNNKFYIYDGGWLGGTNPGAFT